MNVLSVADGMSCGQIALRRAGIKYDNYYASEIDKYPIAVTQHHYPETVQLIWAYDGNTWGCRSFIIQTGTVQEIDLILRSRTKDQST